MIESTLGSVSAGENLSMPQMSAVIDSIMTGSWTDAQIGLLLVALREKGETVDEIAGAAAVLRRHMTPIRSRREGIIDTCGTGGDSSDTFNISTAAALVTAAAGVPVAKHGNRSITSRSGSADALAALGVNIQADVACVERCLDRLGICFCFAPLMHPSMKCVAAVRKQLGVPTIFNLLGPLSNPAGAHYQLMGVGQAKLQPLMAGALERLGIKRALVVRGEDGLDEITIAAPTRVIEVSTTGLREFVWTPEDFGLDVSRLDGVRVGGPQESAQLIREVLAGKPGTARDIVVLNAGAAIWTAGIAAAPPQAAGLAADAIDSGRARQLLDDLVMMTAEKTSAD